MPSFPAGLGYDAEVHEHAPEVLSLLEDDAVRTFAEAVYAVLPAPESDESEGSPGESMGSGEPWPTRAQRIDAVVNRLPDGEPSNRTLYEKTLLMISTAEHGLDAIADRLVAAAGEAPEVSDSQFSGAGSPGVAVEQALYLGTIRSTLRRGELSHFIDGMNAYADRAADRDYATGLYVSSMMGIFSEEMMSDLSELSEEQRDEVTAAIGDLYRRPGVRTLVSNSWNGGDASGKVLADHAVLTLTREGAESYAAFAGEVLADEGVDASYSADRMIESIKSLHSDPRHTPEDRLAAFRVVFTDEHIAENLGDHDYVLRKALKKELLTEQQIAEHGLALAEAMGDDAWMGLGFAAELAGDGELADTAWRRVMDQREGADDRLHYIGHIIESERFELALEYLESVYPSTSEQRKTHRDHERRAKAGIADRDAERSGDESPGVDASESGGATPAEGESSDSSDEATTAEQTDPNSGENE